MQVHSFYMGSKRGAPAREIMELNLIEEFHWTPQEIAAIPYKKLQKYFLIRNQRSVAQESRMNIDNFKRGAQTTGRGQTKRFYREV